MNLTFSFKNLTLSCAELTKIVEERILNNTVVQADCLIWQKKSSKIEIRKKCVQVVQLVYVHYHKQPMSESFIFHTCMNPKCIAEKHIRCVSQRDGILLNKVGWEFESLPTKELSIKGRLNSLLAMSKKDEQTGCIIYTGFIDIRGYGKAEWEGVQYSAHVLAWMLVNNGSTVPDGKTVRHKCTTKACFNIDHLELGTHAQNMYEDRIRDNTINRGSKNSATKISEDLAQKLKDSYYEGFAKERAKQFEVSISIVQRIDTGACWDYLLRNGEDVHAEVRKRKRKNRIENSVKRKRTNPTQEDYERTWNRVLQQTKYEDTGCMVSIKTTEIYPICSLNNRIRPIHILAWELHHGRCHEGYAKSKNLCVRHIYGNACCYNPDHLKIGTAEENSYDRRRHGTMQGISEETAREIYDLKSTMSQKDIAEKFNVSVCIVRSIHRQTRHKYLHRNNGTSAVEEK